VHAKRKKAAPTGIQISDAFTFCIREMEKEFGPLDARIDRIRDKKEDRERVFSYFSKQDGFRKEKTFFFPVDPKEKKERKKRERALSK